MRALFLLVLSAGLMVGCSSTRHDRYDRSGRSYPASARVDTRGGQSRYAVCHNGRNSLTLPERSVRAHLRHGDRFGRCGRQDRRDDRRQDRRRDGRDRDDDRRDDDHGRRGRGNGHGHN